MADLPTTLRPVTPQDATLLNPHAPFSFEGPAYLLLSALDQGPEATPRPHRASALSDLPRPQAPRLALGAQVWWPMEPPSAPPQGFDQLGGVDGHRPWSIPVAALRPGLKITWASCPASPAAPTLLPQSSPCARMPQGPCTHPRRRHARASLSRGLRPRR
jgi:hypothetical protein